MNAPLRPAPLLVAENVSRAFAAQGGFFSLGRKPPVRAVTGFNLALQPHEAIGLVGESGSGKSTAGRLMLGLLAPTEGRVLFEGQDLAGLDPSKIRALRRRMQLVFQDPYSSLDPRRKVADQIADGLTIHNLAKGAALKARVDELLAQVGLNPEHGARFPHAFSGGQRQRIGIARALATAPDVLVADEPVSALDVSVQAQVLALLAKLRSELGLAMLFISHDLPAVRHLCDRVVVLYLGRIMEEGPTREIFAAPRHPYTRARMAAAPSFDRAKKKTRLLLAGEPPSPSNPPPGCVFHTRCPHAAPKCKEAIPPLTEVGPAHRAACVRLGEI